MTTANPKRPYFLRALHEWLEDNDFTAYLVVNATHPDVVAPLEHAQDGQLVLCIAYRATKDLRIDNDAISFAARFGGISQELWIPMAAVIALYAKEDSSHALIFDPSEYAHISPEQATSASNITNNQHQESKKVSPLKIIK